MATISGTILDQDGKPFPGLKVIAFSKTLRAEQPLGNTHTDSAGKYTIQYSLPNEVQNVGIFIRIFTEVEIIVGHITLIMKGQSPIEFQAPTDLVINFTVGDKRSKDYIEIYEFVNQAIAGQDIKISQLQENDQHQDISFLANETGQDPQRITLLSKAHILSEDSHISGIATIEPAIFYGLLMQSFPVDLNTLLKLKSESISAGIKKAITEKLIPEKSDQEINVILEQFNQLSTDAILTGTDAKSKDFQKLSSTVLTPDLQKAFVGQYFKDEATPENFWTNLANLPDFSTTTGAVAIANMKSLLTLHQFTNSAALSTLLFQAEHRDIRGLSALDERQWKTKIDNLSADDIPAEITGESPDKRRENYALALTDLVNQLFPTDVFKHKLEIDDSDLFRAIKGEFSDFLTSIPDFDIRTNNLAALLAEKDPDNLLSDDFKKELFSINRVAKLSPSLSYNHVSAIRAAELNSATDIVTKYSAQSFAETFAGKISAADAKVIYANAKQIDNRSTVLALSHKMKRDVSIYVIDGATPNQPSDYESMFNDNKLCDCEECQSVYSPAAYFVDILSFMQQHNGDAYTKLTARRELTARRPDLIEILLTCENTNTPLPYIDLVNEILEDAVSLGQHTTYQTTNTAEELLAYPEYTNTDAYHFVLSRASSAFNLPLNLPLEETRLYLDKLGVKRVELMELFHDKHIDNKYDDKDIATEYLQLSEEERGFLTTSSLTGFDKVTHFLATTGLSYIDLVQLLECTYLNPFDATHTRKITIGPTRETCVVDELTIVSADEDDAKKANLLIRLRKKTGWGLYDIDKALKAFDLSTTDTSSINLAIVQLSNLARIKAAYGLSIPQLIAFWSPIDTGIYIDYTQEGQPELPSLYKTLFQNKKVINPVDQAFANPDTLLGKLSEHTATIFAALHLTQPDFDLLLGFTPQQAAVVEDTLTLPNLSILYRYATLSRILRLSITELLQAKELTATDPFATTTTTLQFIDKIKLIQASGFKIIEVKNLLTASSAPAQNDTVINTALTTLRDALKKVELDFADLVLPELIPIPPDATPEKRAEIEVKNIQIQTEIDKIRQKNSTYKLQAQRNTINDTLSNFFKTEAKFIDVFITLDETKDSSFNYSKFIQSYGPLFTQDEVTSEIKWILPEVKTTFAVLSQVWNRLLPVIAKLKITTGEFIYFRKNDKPLKIKGIWDLPASTPIPFSTFENLFQLIRFRNSLAVPALDWYTIFDTVIPTPSDEAKFIASLAKFSNITESTVNSLFKKLNYAFPDDAVDGERLVNLLICANKVAQLGASVDKVFTLTTSFNLLIVNASNSTLKPSDKALIAKSILKSKYDEVSWLAIIKPISNQLRTRKRDALVSYILTADALQNFRVANNITSTNSLFEHFLIDVEMDACMVTSRIKQAISSMQLFVDRCLMNLESGITLDDTFAKQWNSWRKMYRVWEANRKVFLYPENWIEPDLRDDKSPFFKELESKLRQNEVTEETAQNALLGYLEKLDTVANLEVVGVFPDEATKIVYVIGRTRNIPHQYYLTKQVNNVWSAWEKIDVDIEGDHILPVVWNNRLMLFWGMFTEKQAKSGSSTKITPVPNRTGEMDLNSTPSPTYLEMKLAWSEYKNGKWGAKKVSKESCSVHTLYLLPSVLLRDTSTSVPGGGPEGEGNGDEPTQPPLPPSTKKIPAEKNMCFLVSSISNESSQLIIRLYRAIKDNTFNYSEFLIDTCHAIPVVKNENVPVKVNLPPFTTIDSSKIKEYNESPLKMYLSDFYGHLNDSIMLFNNTPGTFQILPNHHEIDIVKLSTFFYENTKNNFFVQSFGGLHTPPDTLPTPGGILVREPIDIGGSFVSTRHNNLARNSVPLSNTSLSNQGIISNFSLGNPYLTKSFYFQTFYHPNICEFIRILNTDGIDGLYKETTQNKEAKDIFIRNGAYDPQPVVSEPYPVEKVDFDYTGVYSLYNWELFFHIPLLMATRLMQNQKFEEARKWFHYIFDPTSASSTASGAERFWIAAPFKQEIRNGILSIKDLIENGGADLEAQLTNWENNPFKPHAVAQLRIAAYMRTTVMKYIDNLIAWGDQLFQRDTLESINEATLLYVLAGNMLGKRPERIPPRAIVEPQSFFTINPDLDRFSNAKVAIQSIISPNGSLDSEGDSRPLISLFCMPKNDKLLSYWDTVADRLFKIRHCMNIAGVVRQLPLFEPPIDPALLVRATAAGLDLNAVINDMNVSLPNYRFQVMLQKANEFCNDVKGLGNELLSALEKQDAEQLSLLRSSHEINMLELMRDIKVAQRDEAQASLDGLNKSKEVIDARLKFYTSREYRNTSEQTYFYLSQSANAILGTLELNSALAALRYLIPEFKIGSGFTIGSTYGGLNLGNAVQAALEGGQYLANALKSGADMANSIGTFQRRDEDWKFQAQSAGLEIKQIDKQIAAAEIRLAIAENDLTNHDVQIANAKEVDDYMRGKFTNAELYDYMVGQISGVYFQSYQLAYQTAKKAEKCFQHELGITPSTPFIQYGYWDSLKKGLLSGEKLQYDLRRLENAYMEQNIREFEITKHISLKQLDPYQLLALRENGSCNINLPEELFDLDYPGHYLRQVKAVSLTIPCIVGPYISVNATLRLTSSSTRVKTDLLANGNYPRSTDSDDKRFTNKTTVTSAIVTSNAQNDSGVFQLNFQDERYLPFERAGAISQWTLELMEVKTLRQFDYNTISDVVMHLSYTAREDTVTLKPAAVQHLKEITNTLGNVSFQRLFSLKHDFPTDWHKWQLQDQPLVIKLEKHHFPYFATVGKLTIQDTPTLYARVGANIDLDHTKTMNLAQPDSAVPAWTLTATLDASDKSKDDWYLVVNYSVNSGLD